MEPVQEVRAPEAEPAAAAAGKVAGEDLPQVPAETVSARIVGQKLPIAREAPAMRSNVPSAGQP